MFTFVRLSGDIFVSAFSIAALTLSANASKDARR
jgi:hypothetical protein